MNDRLVVPCSYQGGKQKLAAQILDVIQPAFDRPFYDLCCGSGAVSLELVNRGFDPRRIMMVDASPWGVFWELVGRGTFDINRFAALCRTIPSDLSQVQSYVQTLAQKPIGDDAPYVFLILQAATFGSKPVWISGSSWVTPGFRSHWMPTATSVRRSPCVPIAPTPALLVERVRRIAQKMRGCVGVQANVHDVVMNERATVYVDPPYDGMTGYGNGVDTARLVEGITAPCYVSEGRPLTDNAVRLTAGRKASSISGNNRRGRQEEWLTVFNGEQALAQGGKENG